MTNQPIDPNGPPRYLDLRTGVVIDAEGLSAEGRAAYDAKHERRGNSFARIVDRLVELAPVVLPLLVGAYASAQADARSQDEIREDSAPAPRWLFDAGLQTEIGNTLRGLKPTLSRIGIDHDPADIATIFARRKARVEERQHEIHNRIVALLAEAEAKHEEEHGDEPPAELTATQIANVDLFLARVTTAITMHNENPALTVKQNYYQAPEALKLGRELFPADAIPVPILESVRAGNPVPPALLEAHIADLRAWAEGAIRKDSKKPCCDDCAKSGGSCKDKAINRARAALEHTEREIAFYQHAIPRLANRTTRLSVDVLAQLFDLDRQTFDGV